VAKISKENIGNEQCYAYKKIKWEKFASGKALLEKYILDKAREKLTLSDRPNNTDKLDKTKY